MFWLAFWVIVGPFILMAWFFKIIFWDIPWAIYALVYELNRRSKYR